MAHDWRAIHEQPRSHVTIEGRVQNKTKNNPDDMRRGNFIVLMLVHRLRRWPSIKTTLDQHLICRTSPENRTIPRPRNEMNRALGHLCAHIG